MRNALWREFTNSGDSVLFSERHAYEKLKIEAIPFLLPSQYTESNMVKYSSFLLRPIVVSQERAQLGRFTAEPEHIISHNLSKIDVCGSKLGL